MARGCTPNDMPPPPPLPKKHGKLNIHDIILLPVSSLVTTAYYILPYQIQGYAAIPHLQALELRCWGAVRVARSQTPLPAMEESDCGWDDPSWLFGCLVGWLLGYLVGCLFGWLVDESQLVSEGKWLFSEGKWLFSEGKWLHTVTPAHPVRYSSTIGSRRFLPYLPKKDVASSSPLPSLPTTLPCRCPWSYTRNSMITTTSKPNQ